MRYSTWPISAARHFKNDMPDTRTLRDVALTASTDEFLEAVYSNLLTDRTQGGSTSEELAVLHNEGVIDVIAAFRTLKNATLGSRPDFFLTRHVFEDALPKINADVNAVMCCVLHLFREAGEDLAAGAILNSYIEFCAKDSARPREALQLIEADPETLIEMLSPTISAGSRIDHVQYLNEAIRLSRHSNIELRRCAVFSISMMHWPQGADVPKIAAEALEQTVSTETDDRILASAIKAALMLYEQDNRLGERSTALIITALRKGDVYALYAAAEMLGRTGHTLPPELLDAVLCNLRRVKPEHAGTINLIDYGIARLLKNACLERALQFLEELLDAHGGKINLGMLDSVATAIRDNPALISKVLTRWFLKNRRTLWDAIHEIVETGYGEDLCIEIDRSELNVTGPSHIVFIARKAVGYFFLRPVTAASVVLSLMHHASDAETLHALGELLFDPLLLNYPGKVGDYVQEQVSRESGKVKETIERALTSVEAYLETQRSIPCLPALHPSQFQCESYRRHISEAMTRSMKEAEKKSVLLNLVSRSTLLYGNKSINYIHTGDGEPHRMEMPLSSHSMKMELPRMANIDPHGLDYMLRVFRVETLRT